MKEASRADFPGYGEDEIFRASRRQNGLLALGLFLAVLMPLVLGVWTIATDRPLQYAAYPALVLAPIGFVLFGLSLRAPASCRLCGQRLHKFWCIEHRRAGRYSGMLAVCHACRAYQALLTSDDFD